MLVNRLWLVKSIKKLTMAAEYHYFLMTVKLESKLITVQLSSTVAVPCMCLQNKMDV